MLYGSHYYFWFSDRQNADFALFTLIKQTNLDINDATCLHIVHILQHPNSCPTTKSIPTTMGNALKKIFSPLPVGKYKKSTTHSAQCCHEGKEYKSSLGAERVQVFGALCRLWSKKKLVAEKQRETHLLSNKWKWKRMKDFIEWETAMARNRAEDTVIAIMHEQEDTKNAEHVELITREPEATSHDMMAAIGDGLRSLASSDNEEDREDVNGEDTRLGMLSEDNKPSWIMGPISSRVQQHMLRFRLKQMKLEELRHLGCGDTAGYFHQSVKNCGRIKLRVPAVVKPETDDGAAAATSTTFGECMEFVDIIPGISQMPQGTTGQGSSHM